jgi:arginine/serine-rich splicing factor 16
MWHEARKSERKVHDLMDAARRRAQRRAAYLARRRGDPQQALQVSGTRCRVHRDDALYQATEDQQGLCVSLSLSLSLSLSRYRLMSSDLSEVQCD